MTPLGPAEVVERLRRLLDEVTLGGEISVDLVALKVVHRHAETAVAKWESWNWDVTDDRTFAELEAAMARLYDAVAHARGGPS